MRSSLLATMALAGPVMLATWALRVAPPPGDTGGGDTGGTWVDTGDTGDTGGDTAVETGGETGGTGGIDTGGDTGCDTGPCGAAVDTSPQYSAAELAGEEGGWGCATAPRTLALGWLGLVALATRRRRADGAG